MTKEEHLFVKLMEECAEVIQRTSKLLQFGPTEVQEGQTQTNIERLVFELKDMQCTMVMLGSLYGNLLPGDYSNDAMEAHLAARTAKYKRFLALSIERGCVIRD